MTSRRALAALAAVVWLGVPAAAPAAGPQPRSTADHVTQAYYAGLAARSGDEVCDALGEVADSYSRLLDFKYCGDTVQPLLRARRAFAKLEVTRFGRLRRSGASRATMEVGLRARTRPRGAPRRMRERVHLVRRGSAWRIAAPTRLFFRALGLPVPRAALRPAANPVSFLVPDDPSLPGCPGAGPVQWQADPAGDPQGGSASGTGQIDLLGAALQSGERGLCLTIRHGDEYGWRLSRSTFALVLGTAGRPWELALANSFFEVQAGLRGERFDVPAPGVRQFAREHDITIFVPAAVLPPGHRADRLSWGVRSAFHGPVQEPGLRQDRLPADGLLTYDRQALEAAPQTVPPPPKTTTSGPGSGPPAPREEEIVPE